MAIYKTDAEKRAEALRRKAAAMGPQVPKRTGPGGYAPSSQPVRAPSSVPQSSNTGAASISPGGFDKSKWSYQPGQSAANETNVRDSTDHSTKNLSAPTHGQASEDYWNAVRQTREQNEWLWNNPEKPFDPSGGGGPGGGDGGAAVRAAANSAATAKSLSDLLGSNAFDGRDISPELEAINAGVSADQGSAATAYERMLGTINGQGNAYADMELTQAATLDPDLAALLSSQGADSGAYAAEVAWANTQAANAGRGDEMFRKRMAAGREEERDYQVQANGQAGEFARSELASAGSSMTNSLKEKKRVEDLAKQDQRMQILMQLISTMGENGESVDISKYMGA
jgi:hypothetical protein